MRVQAFVNEFARVVHHLNFGGPKGPSEEVDDDVFDALVEAGFIDADGTNKLGASKIKVPNRNVPVSGAGMLDLAGRLGYEFRWNTTADRPEIKRPPLDGVEQDWEPAVDGLTLFEFIGKCGEIATAAGKAWTIIGRDLRRQIVTCACAPRREAGDGSSAYTAVREWLETKSADCVMTITEVITALNASNSIMQRFESVHRLPAAVYGDVKRALLDHGCDWKSVKVPNPAGPGKISRRRWVTPGSTVARRGVSLKPSTFGNG